jgi:hypothetical protein
MLLKETLIVRALGISQIPMIFYVGPRVLEHSDAGCVVKIPLGYRTKNHLGSMYFGALAVGADLSGGLNAAFEIWKNHKRVTLVFKDFHADYLKRPDADVVFRCSEGEAIKRAVEEADRSGERVNLPVHITATAPSKYGDEPVARFTLGLSLKRK